MFAVATPGLVILCLAMGAQVFLRSHLVSWVRIIFWSSASIIFGAAAYWSYRQYALWAGSEFTRFLLPPHQGIGYFFEYVGTRILGYPLIAFVAALGAAMLLSRMNSRFGGRFCGDEEPWLFALGVFLSGYPAFLLYGALLLCYGVGVTLYYTQRGENRRVAFTFAWLPLAILAILIVRSLPASLLNAFTL